MTDLSADAFEAYMGGVRAPLTAKKYSEVVRVFLRQLQDAGMQSFADCPKDLLIQYTTTLATKGYTATTVKLYVAAIRRYIAWARQRGAKIPPLYTPDLPRIHNKIRTILPHDRLSRYFELAATSFDEPWRSAIMLMPCVGLRCSELSSLRLDAISKCYVDLAGGGKRSAISLRVVSKGGDEKTVPVMFDGEQVLVNYLTAYRKKTKKSVWLFPAPRNPSKHITDSSLRHQLIQLREPLGLDDITPHTLRRTYVVYLHRKGVDLATIAKIAGHKNINTTLMHYLNLDPDDILCAVHNPRRTF